MLLEWILSQCKFTQHICNQNLAGSDHIVQDYFVATEGSVSACGSE